MEEEIVEVNEETGEIVEVKPKDEKKKDIVPYAADSAESMFMSTGGFSLIQRWGKMLAQSAMVPEHLQGQPADCALVVTQAMQWGLNPLIVAQSSYIARGKVGYEGKFIASLVNRDLAKKLNYRFTGEGKNLKVAVFGTMKGEQDERTVEGTWEDWSNDRNPAWKTMPKQMMVYRGAREWARRHNPGVISGILSIDEVQDLEVRETVIDGTYEEKPKTTGEEMEDLLGDVEVSTPVDAEELEKADAKVEEERRQAAAAREADKVTPKKRGRPKGSKNKTNADPQPSSDTLGGKTQTASVDDLFD